MLKLINQHEDQKVIYKRIGSHSESEKRGKVDQSHCTNIGQILANIIWMSRKKKETTSDQQQEDTEEGLGSNELGQFYFFLCLFK